MRLTINDLAKAYKADLWAPKRQALRGVSCSFAPGSVTALLGHNGAGKTTTLRIILGLTRADRGEVTLDGQAISTAARRYLGYVPEVNRLPLRLTPLEVLRLQLLLYPGAGTRAQREERVQTALTRVGLEAAARQQVGQFSKGMGRRLAWALATLHEPRVLILDEPFSGLDPLGRADMRQWIDSQAQAGCTIVLASHELAYLPQLCQRLVILKKGRLVHDQAYASERPVREEELLVHFR